MKIFSVVMVLFTILVAGCKNKSQNILKTYNESAVMDSPPALDSSKYLPSGSYQMVLNKDSAILTVELKDNMINGDLNYMFFEKDVNPGTINGVWKDSLVHTFYTFRSGGVTSVREMICVREMIWKIKEGELWPAFGEFTKRNDTVFFAQPGNLQFDSVHPFIKI